MANPEIDARQVAGLNATWIDPEKRRAQAALTIERMNQWRKRELTAAQTVLRQIP